MPFSTPPAPSEPPKSRILTPLTGNANRPRAEAKAMAGLNRAGSFSAPRFGLPLTVAGAPCRLAVAAAFAALFTSCLLYTSDAADDLLCVALGGRRIIKKKT